MVAIFSAFIRRIDRISEKNFAYLEYAVSSKYLTTIHKEKLYSLNTHKCNFGKVQWLKNDFLLNCFNNYSTVRPVENYNT